MNSETLVRNCSVLIIKTERGQKERGEWYLARDGVWETDLVSPVSTKDWNNGELGLHDGTTDSGGHLLGALHAEADMTVHVTNDDEGLELHALTSGGLLLHRLDLHDLILKSREEEVDDAALLDGHGVEVDVVNLGDLSLLHEPSELGAWHPLLLVLSLSFALALAFSLSSFAALAAFAFAAEAAESSFTWS